MKTIFVLARLLGILAPAAAALLWFVMLVVNPYSGHGATTGTYIEAIIMVGLSLYAIYAAWKVRPLRMGVVAVVSLVPVGLYTLGTPGMFRLIGVSNLLLLLAAVALHESRPTPEAASALS